MAIARQLPFHLGRRSLLTEHLAEEIARRLRAGLSRAAAAESLGIARETFWRWMRWGEEAEHCEVPDCADPHHGPPRGDLTYADFCNVVRRSEAEAVVAASRTIVSAFDRDWRAAAWWLERRCPEEWGKQRAPVAGDVVLRVVYEDPDRTAGH